MFVGRRAEVDQLEHLLVAARGGTSATLVIAGDAGVGKTALLEQAVARASGFTILRAQGIESESELAFAGLLELLWPIRERFGVLPDLQSATLAGAVGLGPPVTDDRFAIATALLLLLSRLAEAGPILLAVDDTQWLDAPSREAIEFVARRLLADAVAIVLATRGTDASREKGVLPLLELSGLERHEAAELLETLTNVRPAPLVMERVLDETAGNPLAIVELADTVSTDQLAGRAILPQPLPVGRSIRRAYGARLERLDPAVRTALVLVAAADSPALGPISAALTAMGLSIGTLEAAESDGLVQVHDGEVAFRHPLIRSVAYHAAASATRRAAHQALASVLVDPDSADRRAWHLAAAAIAPDEHVAQQLEDAAARAIERGAPSAAARALEHAATFSEDPSCRTRRLLAAAENHARIGSAAHAIALLDRALLDAADDESRAAATHLRGRLELASGRIDMAHQILGRGAQEVGSQLPTRATLMLVDDARARYLAGEMDAAIRTARRAYAMSESLDPWTRAVAGVALSRILGIAGAPPDDLPVIDWQWAATTGRLTRLVELAGGWLIWATGEGLVRELLDGVVRDARRSRAGGSLTMLLAYRADVEIRTGDWADGMADASEALELAELTAQPVFLPYVLTCLARIAAGRGQRDGALSWAARAIELARGLGLTTQRLTAEHAIANVDLGAGRFDQAVGRLSRIGAEMEAFGYLEPSALPWQADLVEALLRLGRAREAGVVLERFEAAALRSERAWNRALLARCKGMTSGADAADARFEEALHWHEQAPSRFERARTALAYGEHLRRQRRRSEARIWLHEALVDLEQLGAEPWADTARAELGLTGAARPPRQPSGLHALTPQELRVARVVAQGMTNQEAAGALLLSPKTVEFHLGNIYGKLGIRSRTELVRVVSADTPKT